MEIYRGESPSWHLVRHIAGDRACRIFGFMVGRLFVGTLWRTNRRGMTPDQIAVSENRIACQEKQKPQTVISARWMDAERKLLDVFGLHVIDLSVEHAEREGRIVATHEDFIAVAREAFEGALSTIQPTPAEPAEPTPHGVYRVVGPDGKFKTVDTRK